MPVKRARGIERPDGGWRCREAELGRWHDHWAGRIGRGAPPHTLSGRTHRQTLIYNTIRRSFALDAHLVARVPITARHRISLRSNEEPIAPLLNSSITKDRGIRPCPAFREQLSAPRFERPPLEGDSLIVIWNADVDDGAVAVELEKIRTFCFARGSIAFKKRTRFDDIHRPHRLGRRDRKHLDRHPSGRQGSALFLNSPVHHARTCTSSRVTVVR